MVSRATSDDIVSIYVQCWLQLCSSTNNTNKQRASYQLHNNHDLDNNNNSNKVINTQWIVIL